MKETVLINETHRVNPSNHKTLPTSDRSIEDEEDNPEMPILVSSPSSSSSPLSATSLPNPRTRQFFLNSTRISHSLSARRFKPILSSQLCAPDTLVLDKSKLSVAETVSEDELWAAACLRVRTFNDFTSDSFGIEVSNVLYFRVFD